MGILVNNQLSRIPPNQPAQTVGKAGGEAPVEHADKLDGFDKELEQVLRSSDAERARHVVGGDVETQARIDALHTQKPSEAQQATDAIAAGRIDRNDFQHRIFALIGADFSVEAQESMVHYLERVRDPLDLGWAASTLRRALPGKLPIATSGTPPLLEHLTSVERSDGLKLDRAAYRTRMTEVLSGLEMGEDGRSVLDGRAARRLLYAASKVTDKADLLWLHRQVESCLGDGRNVKLTDDGRGVLERFFVPRLNITSAHINSGGKGSVNPYDLLDAAFAARKSGFSDETVQRYHTLVDRIQGDPDALNYAREVFARQVRRALRTTSDPGERQHLETIGAKIDDKLASLVAGTLDRRAKWREIHAWKRQGLVNETEMSALKTAVLTSATPEDFTLAALRASDVLGYPIFSRLLAEMHEEQAKRAEEAEREEAEHRVRAEKKALEQRRAEVDARLRSELTAEQREYWAVQYFLSMETRERVEVSQARTVDEMVDNRNDLNDARQAGQEVASASRRTGSAA